MSIGYFTKIEGSTYYNLTGWPVLATDTAGDMEAALLASGEGGTLILDGGVSGITYSGTDFDADNTLATTHINQTIKPGTTSGHNGVVTLDGVSSTYVIRADHNGTILEHFTVTDPIDTTQAGIIRIGANTTTNHLIFTSMSATFFVAAGDLDSNHTVVTDSNKSDILLVNAGTGTVNLNYWQVTDSKGYIRGFDGILNINQSVMVGFEDEIVRVDTNDCIATITNSILIAASSDLDNQYTLRDVSGTGTITYQNSIVLPNPWNPKTYFTAGDVIDGGNNVIASPLFVKPRRTAIVVLQIDDTANFDLWTYIADYATTKGVVVDIAADTGQLSGSDWTELQTYVGNGHGVSSHSWGHSNLTETDAFEIQYTGAAATATMSIDVSGDTLTITTAGGVDDVSLTLSDYLRISNLAVAINDIANFTTDYLTDPMGQVSKTRVTSVENLTNQDIKTAVYTVQIDETRYFSNEIDGSLTDLDDHNLSTNAFVYPYCDQNSGVIDAVQTAGFNGARVCYTGGDYNLEDLQVYITKAIQLSANIGTSNIARNIHAVLENIKYFGGIVTFFDHTAASYSLANWKTVIDAVATDTQVNVMTLSDAITAIRNTSDGVLPAGTDADADGLRWTRTFDDETNYKLLHSSSAINTGAFIPGVNDGGELDPWGKPVYNLPNIGVDQGAGAGQKIIRSPMRPVLRNILRPCLSQ